MIETEATMSRIRDPLRLTRTHTICMFTHNTMMEIVVFDGPPSTYGSETIC